MKLVRYFYGYESHCLEHVLLGWAKFLPSLMDKKYNSLKLLTWGYRNCLSSRPCKGKTSNLILQNTNLVTKHPLKYVHCSRFKTMKRIFINLFLSFCYIFASCFIWSLTRNTIPFLGKIILLFLTILKFLNSLKHFSVAIYCFVNIIFINCTYQKCF